MELLIVMVLFLIIGFATNNRTLRILGRTVGLSGLAFVVSVSLISIACHLKFLPWAFCGDLYGVVHIGLLAMGIAVVTGVTVFLVERKRP